MNDYMIVNGQLCHADDELYHYGVLGMKWGVRRGRADKAYAKASKKLKKLDAKIEKRRAKYVKKADRAEDYRTRTLALRSVRSRTANAAKNANRKLAAAEVKGKKWVDAMSKAFKNTDISLTTEQIDMGKRYTEAVNKRTEAFTYKYQY